MLFSVVIPTLRRPELLAETLAGLLTCDPAADEIIVVDGDPERSASDVVRRTTRSNAPPIRYLPTAPGAARQRNLGVAAASGDVVLFLDDDVAIGTSTFAVLSEAYREPSLVGVTGRVVGDRSRLVSMQSPLRKLLPGGGSEGSFTRYGYPRYIQRVEVARDVEFMLGCFMSARRSVAEEVGFDENLPGPALAEDEDFSFRLSRHGRLRYLPELVVEHKMGFRGEDSRALGRMIVANRAYLFRKNFQATPLARAQFAMLVFILFAHRLAALDPAGAQGVLEGSAQAWRERNSHGTGRG